MGGSRAHRHDTKFSHDHGAASGQRLTPVSPRFREVFADVLAGRAVNQAAPKRSLTFRIACRGGRADSTRRDPPSDRCGAHSTVETRHRRSVGALRDRARERLDHLGSGRGTVPRRQGPLRTLSKSDVGIHPGDLACRAIRSRPPWVVRFHPTTFFTFPTSVRRGEPGYKMNDRPA